MTPSRSALTSRRGRWLAPVAAVALVAGLTTVPRLADAADVPEDLPPRSAAELLQDVAGARVDGLSGTVVHTSRLGLPEISGSSSDGAVSLPGLLSGSTTARLWLAGQDRQRLAVTAPFAEYAVVRSGRDVWTYDSASSDVTHLVLPAPDAEQPEVAASPAPLATPQEAAERLLEAVDPTTRVSVGRSAVVAGRPAYELVLVPRNALTLVEQVRIAVDGATKLPLRVQVFGEGQTEPALETAFTEVRFDVPDDEVFGFVPPPGSDVTERTLPRVPHGSRGEPSPDPSTGPVVVGDGWASVLVLPQVDLPEDAAAVVDSASTRVDGGRALRSALLSVLLLDDRRVLVGAVPVDRLQQVAQAGR